MHHEFLSGYVTLVEGEKDPRNLMTAFAIARVILIEFDIADHIEVCFMFPSIITPTNVTVCTGLV
jgi:DNA repair/transcription protein MET18/MMS19